MKPDAEPGRLRPAFTILITVAAAALAGRILNTELVYEPRLYQEDPVRLASALTLPFGANNATEAAVLYAATAPVWTHAASGNPPRTWPLDRPASAPTYGSNDRSRWDTVRALVDHGTYVIGYRETDSATGRYHDSGIVTEDGWHGIDKVLKPEPEGQVRPFYSSKPPFLPTLMAGEYWLLKHLVGWSIVGHYEEVTRTCLLTWNVLPFVIYLVLLARLSERWGQSDWARLFVVASACFATYLTPFAITFNNHSIATYCAVFALYPALSILQAPPGEVSWRRYVLAGFFASFTACAELPALSFAVALFAILLVHAPRRTLLGYLPAALVPALFFFGTNYLAIGELVPAYEKLNTPWYQYAGSNWIQPQPGELRRGIDWARLYESRAVYAFHLLVGHHGIFSLTPINLLALVGMVGAFLRFVRRPLSVVRCNRGRTTHDGRFPQQDLVGALGLVLTLTLIAFYLTVSSRNYGGWTTGPRWFFWLTPFWLLAMLPVVDRLATRRWGRGLAYVLLALSVLSVSYPAWNPWRHPWLYNYMDWRGWIPY
jgi:hypothetical protein